MWVVLDTNIFAMAAFHPYVVVHSAVLPDICRSAILPDIWHPFLRHESHWTWKDLLLSKHECSTFCACLFGKQAVALWQLLGRFFQSWVSMVESGFFAVGKIQKSLLSCFLYFLEFSLRWPVNYMCQKGMKILLLILLWILICLPCHWTSFIHAQSRKKAITAKQLLLRKNKAMYQLGEASTLPPWTLTGSH